jgi:hypothetical protein
VQSGAHREPALLVPSLLAAAVIGFTLGTAGRGLDLMDESYVLRLVAFPNASRAAGEPYLFAFLVNPLYQLVGADVARFRVLGILIVVAVAGAVAHQVLGALSKPLPRLVVVAVLLATMAASTTVFLLEVRVLSYRSVGLVGLLLVVAGVARAVRPFFVSAGLLLGVGGWLTFTARPTSAAGAALVVVTLYVTKQLAWRSAPWAALGVVLGATTTLAIARMTPVEVYSYLAGGVHLDSLLGGRQGLGTLFGLSRPYPEALVVFGLPLLLAGAVVVAWRSGVRRESVVIVDVWGALGLVALGVCLTPPLVMLLAPATRGFKSLALLAVVAIVGLFAVLTTRADDDRREVAPLLVLLLATPYLFSLGSNRDALTTMGQAAAVWVLFVAAAWMGRVPRARWAHRQAPLAIGLSVAVVATAMATVAVFLDGPDGPQLSRATESAPVAGGTLHLRPETARIFHGLHDSAEANGLDDQAVVDLSGVGAGYAFALGAPPLGRAHLFSTWSGHEVSARWALSQTNCRDRERAWLIVGTNPESRLGRAWSADWPETLSQYESVYEFSDVRYRATLHFRLLRPRDGSVHLSCAD